MLDSLTYQYSVKWVAVKHRQLREIQDSLLFEGKGSDAMPFALGRDESLGEIRETKSAKTMFDHDLPNRDGAQVDVVARIYENIPGLRGECFVTSNDPQERARVEQNLHRISPPNACRISSGSGLKKSGGTVNLPFASPTGRFSERRD